MRSPEPCKPRDGVARPSLAPGEGVGKAPSTSSSAQSPQAAKAVHERRDRPVPLVEPCGPNQSLGQHTLPMDFNTSVEFRGHNQVLLAQAMKVYFLIRQ